MYPKFKTDLERGTIFENYIESYFKRRGWAIKRAKGNVPGYDLIITRGRQSFLIEIKHDVLSDKTNNYCLEFDSLNHTQADILIIGTPQESYLLTVKEARTLFNQYPHKHVGDFMDNFAAIVPKSVFNNNYRRL